MKLSEMILLGAKGFKPADIKEFGSANVSTDEIIKLADAGYSAADVKELISLAGSDESLQPKGDGTHDHFEPDDHPDPKGESGEPDYKDQVSKMQSENEDLKKQILDLQNKNASKDLGAGHVEKTDRETIIEAFKNIY